MDTATQSNYNDIRTDHVSFDWVVDFDTKLLSGSATHNMTVKRNGVKDIVCAPTCYVVMKHSINRFSPKVDTGDLKINAVIVDRKPAEVGARRNILQNMAMLNTSISQYNLDARHPIMGSALHVSLPGGRDQGATVLVEITYETATENSALQWLDKG